MSEFLNKVKRENLGDVLKWQYYGTEDIALKNLVELLRASEAYKC